MKRMALAALAAASLGLAACSDNAVDQTTTQSVPAQPAPATSDGSGGATASGGTGTSAAGSASTTQDGPVNATADNTTTQTIETETDVPESGTGGASQTKIDGNTLTPQPAPAQ